MKYPRTHFVDAKFTESPLEGWSGPGPRDTVAVPAVRGTALLQYGEHSYYFYNFERRKLTRVDIGHLDVIRPGVGLLAKALGKSSTPLGFAGMFFRKYHYGFGFLEQIMLMTVPHTATPLGGGRFLMSLWSYFGYFLVDCVARTVEYVVDPGRDGDWVFGSRQWLAPETGDLFQMRYSLSDSFRGRARPEAPPRFTISRTSPGGMTSEVWSGRLSDYMHDVMVDKTGRFCVACELGMHKDDSGGVIPSKVLVLDMEKGSEWVISRFTVAAHAQFDPEDPRVIYFSNHNFYFIPTSLAALLRNATYSLKFNGPASVHKYRLTDEGPVELGVFSDPAMFRLTNFHVFVHRGARLLAAMGFPNLIYLADAETMGPVGKFEIAHGTPSKCVVGTIAPSLDGEFLYVQTTREFQVVSLPDGRCVMRLPLGANHSAANHMQTDGDTAW